MAEMKLPPVLISSSTIMAFFPGDIARTGGDDRIFLVVGAFFVKKGQRKVEEFRKAFRQFRATHIGCDDNRVVDRHVFVQGVAQHVIGEELIERHAEKRSEGLRMEVERNHAGNSGGFEEIRAKTARDADAGLVFFLATGGKTHTA